MANLVEIKYKTNNIHPQVSINGEPLSPFSTLSNYIYDDIFCWANNFFEIIDGDLAEDYHVSITGHPFQAFILRAAAKNAEFCKRIDFYDYEGAISISEKYDFASKLYINAGNTASTLSFKVNNPEKFSSLASNVLTLSSEASSTYCIARDESEAEEFAGKYCFILSDKNEVVQKRNYSFCFFVDSRMLELGLDYFASYHVRLDLINEVMNNVGKYATDEKSALEFEAYVQESYKVWPEDLPDKLEKGEQMAWNIEVFPSCFSPDGVTVSSSNPSVLSYDNSILTANDDGTAEIRITDNTGKELFCKAVEVSHHNYATSITVILPSTTLMVGETLNFRTVVTPVNAEDINEINYSVSDERVAVLTGTNELYALATGRVCVTVSTPRTSAKFYIRVPEPASDIALSVGNELTLPFSSEATIYATALPLNAVPEPKLVWSLERGGGRAVKITYSDNNRCTIQSKEVGHSVLICQIRGTDIKKKIVITVPQTKGCYIATSVYGSYDCPEVWTLRRYRDEYLNERPLGRLFIKCYYSISPTIVKRFGKNPTFNAFWQRFLDNKIAKLKKKGYESTPYKDNEY